MKMRVGKNDEKDLSCENDHFGGLSGVFEGWFLGICKRENRESYHCFASFSQKSLRRVLCGIAYIKGRKSESRLLFDLKVAIFRKTGTF